MASRIPDMEEEHTSRSSDGEAPKLDLRGEETSRSGTPPKKRVAPNHKHKAPHRRSSNSKLARLKPELQPFSGECTSCSDSEETIRIQQAKKRAKEFKEKGQTKRVQVADSSDEEHGCDVDDWEPRSAPKTSGVFHYAEWFVGKLEPCQRDALKRAFEKATYMNLCAGLGTSIIITEALHRALMPCTGPPQCVCLTECNKDRQAALQRRIETLPQVNIPILASNAILALDDIKDVHGNDVSQPKADILFMGIVCVDISKCSSTPRSIQDPDSESGRSWLDLLQYLRKLRLEDRPNAIVLECVDNLGNARSISGTIEKGTEVVVEALQEVGFIGKWTRLSATHFGLPQRRPRVWGLFAKLRDGLGPKAREERMQQMSPLWSIIQVGMCTGCEPLPNMLARVDQRADGAPSKKAKTRHRARASGFWKQKGHPNFCSKYGLTKSYVSRGRDEWEVATKDILLPREQEAVWLVLCHARQSGRILNWKHGILVSDCGSSVSWLSVTKRCFPCLRPNTKFLLLEQGVARVATGLDCLAIQGIGPNEVKAFHLEEEEDALLRVLAGNGFCANIALVS